MDKTVTIKMNAAGLMPKRWETIMYNSNGSKSVIIRIKNESGAVNYRTYPYEEVGMGKIGRIIWWYLLKLETYLGMW